MTIPGIARRLVEAYGRDAARAKARLRQFGAESLMGVSVFGLPEFWQYSERATFWRSVARACTRVPVPARRGATP
jgi:hypothetical protein